MATINKVTGIEKNSYDYARAYANSQTDNSVVAAELLQAYTLISKNMGISVFDFIQQVKTKGTEKQQAIYLAKQMNNVRPRNALYGVSNTLSTPVFIQREVGA
jgi:hypothetical protein